MSDVPQTSNSAISPTRHIELANTHLNKVETEPR